VNLEVKSRSKDGVQFIAKGKSEPSGNVDGNIEAKVLNKLHGVVLTQSWNTSNAIELKVEVEDFVGKGLKLEGSTQFFPNSLKKAAKLNLSLRQPGFHGKALVDILNGPSFFGDVVVGRNGVLAGAEVGYDFQVGRILKYSLGTGYIGRDYSASVIANNKLSSFGVSYSHRISERVEVAAKSQWDTKTSNEPQIEFGGKYKLDAGTSLKGKVSSVGTVALSLNHLLRPGVQFGFGVQVNTKSLNEPVHKAGLSLTLDL